MPRVVIADDDQVTAALLQALVSIAGVGEVVAVARDGREALDLVVAHEPEIALLDVQMPRLRGPQVAAAIRAYNPHTRVILHTAHVDDDVRREAELLGVPLVDKLHAADTLEDVLTAAAAATDGLRARPIERLVLVALERRPDEAVLVVTADGEVVFYGHEAADLLRLPFPPRPIRLDDMHESLAIVDADGNPLPLVERPLFRALREQTDVEGYIHQRRGDDILRIHARAVAFHGPDHEFLGVADYLQVERSPTHSG